MGFPRFALQCWVLLLPFCSFCQQKPVLAGNYLPYTFFKGLVNDIHDVVIELHADSLGCSGRMTFLRSGEKFTLSGTVSNDTFSLREIDATGQFSGTLQGQFARKNNGKLVFVAQWFNLEKSIGFDVKATEQEPSMDATYCGEKWVRHYQGSYRGSLVDIILSQTNETRLQGCIFFKETGRTFPLSGVIADDDETLKINIESSNFTLLGQITGRWNLANYLSFTFTDELGRKETVTLYMRDDISVGCLEYMDYMTTIALTYPQLKEATTFNDQLVRFVDETVKQFHGIVAEKQMNQPKRDPKFRDAMRVYDWWQIDFKSSKYISVFIAFSSTLDGETSNYTFNYDIEKNKMLEASDIFLNPEGDFKKDVRRYILRELADRPYAADPTFKNWLEKQDFSLFTFQNEGIKFTSEYSPIFGNVSVTVPYYLLSPYFKSSTFVQDLGQ